MSAMIQEIKIGGTLYVDVPNDKFDEISREVDGWADSPNQCCTTMDAIYDMAEDDSEFAKELIKMLDEKNFQADYDDVVIQKVNPK
jgi:hypothetical protein